MPAALKVVLAHGPVAPVAVETLDTAVRRVLARVVIRRGFLAIYMKNVVSKKPCTDGLRFADGERKAHGQNPADRELVTDLANFFASSGVQPADWSSSSAIVEWTAGVRARGEVVRRSNVTRGLKPATGPTHKPGLGLAYQDSVRRNL